MITLRNRIVGFFNERTILSITIASVIAIACVAAQPAYRAFKEWRSDQLLAKSKKLEENGSRYQAFYTARTAALLNRENIEAERQLAMLALTYQHPQAHRFWEAVLQNSKSDANDWAYAIDASFQSADYATAFDYLLRWSDEGVEDPAAYDLRRAQAYAFAGQLQVAADLIAKSMEAYPEDPAIRQFYFYLIGFIGSDESRRELANRILSSGSDSAIDLLWIARQETLPAELRLQAIERAVASTDLSPIESLAVAAVAAPLDTQRASNLIDAIATRIDLSDDDQLAAYSTALCQIGNYKLVRELVEDERAKRSRALFRNLLIAQIETGAEDEAFDTTSQQRNERLTSLAEETLIRAFAFQKTGDQIQYQANIDKSIESAEYADIAFLEQQFIRLGKTDALLKLYRKVSQHPEIGYRAHYQWLELARRLDSEPEIRAALEFSSNWESQLRNPRWLANVVYLKLVYRIDLQNAFQTAQNLASTFHGDPFFRHLLGLAYHQLGQPSVAKQLVSLDLPAPDARSQLIAAAINNRALPTRPDFYLPTELALASGSGPRATRSKN